jgi:hypothetical protein
MSLIRSKTVAVTTTGANGSATGNADSEAFAGEIVGAYIKHHANAPATTDIVIKDKRTGVEIYRKNNANTDIYVAPRALAVDSTGANILSSETNGRVAVPYAVDQGVNVDVAGANVETNHVVVTVLYRESRA